LGAAPAAVRGEGASRGSGLAAVCAFGEAPSQNTEAQSGANGRRGNGISFIVGTCLSVLVVLVSFFNKWQLLFCFNFGQGVSILLWSCRSSLQTFANQRLVGEIVGLYLTDRGFFFVTAACTEVTSGASADVNVHISTLDSVRSISRALISSERIELFGQEKESKFKSKQTYSPQTNRTSGRQVISIHWRVGPCCR
jgi:hypothetical protein